jgi:hydroxymethylpyrimidine/phosphomethylpyrimidine kinase
MIPRILVIAGSDSGGGAGIQADIKTITMLGGHAMTAITAITAQNTVAVTAVHPVPVEMVLAQIDAVISDIGVDAIKIGMIGSARILDAVAERLEGLRRVPVVLDPVMTATSGGALADRETVGGLARLLDLATVVTPNAPELEALTGRKVQGEAAMIAAARMLAELHGCAVLAKGGHLSGSHVVDVLVEAVGVVERWQDAWIKTRHNHGTGCTLASGIAAGIGGGLSLVEAASWARSYLRAALEAGPGLGAGHGPIGHALGIAPFEATGRAGGVFPEALIP